jgi:outer membrane protein insertion porin family
MLNQSNTSKMKTLKFLFALPLLVLLLMVFSFTEKASIPTENETSFLQQEKLVIGTITWEGNTRYSDEYLNEIMGLKPETRYEKENVNHLLSYDPNKTTIDDLYMDNGYLFFNVTLEEDIKDGKANLMFKVYEGATVVVDKIIISGNQKVATKEILELVDIKSGDLFNRSKLIASQRNIAESGYFKADNVGINPIPHDGKLMDIEFLLEEL